MDINLIFSVLILIILALISIEWDEGFIIFLIAFLSIAIAMNLNTIFSISNSNYLGFGELIQLSYAFVGIFGFIKSAYSGKDFFGSVFKHAK